MNAHSGELRRKTLEDIEWGMIKAGSARLFGEVSLS